MLQSDSVALNVPVPLFALDGSHEHLPAQIQTANAEAVQFRTRSPLNPGRRLVMQHEGCRTELEVVTCQEHEAGTYLIDCQVRSSQKGAIRDDWRMEVNWPAQVEIPSSKDRHKARVRDISLFGLGVQLAFKPELDSLLVVHMRSGTGLGRVKHCRSTGRNRYWAGLYLEEFRSQQQDSEGSGKKEEKVLQSLRRLWRQVCYSITGAAHRY
jgi:hypothetical protein